MSLTVATHNGPFHADDVVAFALVRTFVDPDATVVRTRDPEKLDEADIVVDVGAVFDPATRRFDHHQQAYQGPRSAAGMVLDWLEQQGTLRPALAEYLRNEAFTYLDDVDNGRVAPTRGVPCLPRMVDAFNQTASDDAGFHAAFLTVSSFAGAWLEALAAEHTRIEEATAVVKAAMDAAEAAGSNLMEFDAYIRWKEPYYALGGAEHRTEYAMFPGTDGSYRVIGIPPELGDFGQKRPLPEAWAGLVDDELVQVVGVPGAIFCHKNRFIAVFDTREHCLQALRQWDLLTTD